MAHGRRAARVGLLAGLFAAGFLCGSLSQRSADAQIGDLGGKAMEKAADAGGAAGSAGKLGTSIVEMQQHVDGLQKNLETLKQVKAALGG
jgi:hypothetical protein